MLKRIPPLPALAALNLLALFIALVAVPEQPESPPAMFRFLGRLHPVALHLPIGLLAALGVFEILHRFTPKLNLNNACRILLVLAAITAVPTVVFGLLLASEPGYNPDLLEKHEWLGITVAFCASILLFLRPSTTAPTRTRLYQIALIITLGFTAAAGHFGGSLTHGPNYLTEYLPFTRATPHTEQPVETPSPRDGDGEPVDLASITIYPDLIQPMLNNYCIDCHGPSRARAKLRLDSHEHLIKGARNGPVITPGDALRSPLMTTLLLPPGHDLHMPPPDRPQPTAAQKRVLEWWINEGADPEASAKSYFPDPAVVRAIESAYRR